MLGRFASVADPTGVAVSRGPGSKPYSRETGTPTLATAVSGTMTPSEEKRPPTRLPRLDSGKGVVVDNRASTTTSKRKAVGTFHRSDRDPVDGTEVGNGGPDEQPHKHHVSTVEHAPPVDGESHPLPEDFLNVEDLIHTLVHDELLLQRDDLSTVSRALEELVNMLHPSEKMLVEHRRLIDKHGGAQAVLAVMRKHEHKPNILACACAFMMHWMHGTDDTVRRQCQVMQRAGCVPVLVDAIRNFPHVPFVQKGALAALCNYVSNVDSGLEDVHDAGGIPVTIAAMAAHPKLGLLQQRGCRLLLGFCKAPEYRTTVRERGGSQAFQTALVQHGARDECVRRYAADAIFLLSWPPPPPSPPPVTTARSF